MLHNNNISNYYYNNNRMNNPLLQLQHNNNNRKHTSLLVSLLVVEEKALVLVIPARKRRIQLHKQQEQQAHIESSLSLTKRMKLIQKRYFPSSMLLLSMVLVLVLAKQSQHLVETDAFTFIRNVRQKRQRQQYTFITTTTTRTTSITTTFPIQASNSNDPIIYNDFEDFDNSDREKDDLLFRLKKNDSIGDTSSNSNERFNSNINDDDDVIEEDEEDSDNSLSNDQLGDWRSFRRKLITSSLQQQHQTSQKGNSNNNNNNMDASEQQESSTDSSNDDNSYPNKNDTTIIATTTTTTTNTKGSTKGSSSTTTTSSSSSSKPTTKITLPTTTSSTNERILQQQNQLLSQEELWAHEISTPEVGGLMVRMPLEVEIRRNYRHSNLGKKLRHLLQQRILRDNMNTGVDTKSSSSKTGTTGTTKTSKSKSTTAQSSTNKKSSSSNNNDDNDSNNKSFVTVDNMEMAIWYSTAQSLVEGEMKVIAGAAESNGELDSSVLTDDSNEVLQLYLDHQETWQEVCLVLSYDTETSTATTVVLNRPLALQLTDSLGRLVLFGAYASGNNSNKGKDASDSSDTTTSSKTKGNVHGDISIKDFIKAFGRECGVYVGGPDDQHQPAIVVHGIKGLPGAVEIAQGTGIYQGGLAAAVKGVLSGLYKPLEFRFFVGRHSYSTSMDDDDDDDETSDLEALFYNNGVDDDDDDDDMLDLGDDDDDDEMIIPSTLDLDVVLGKYQPVACSRSIALKQCIQLPKPLWHEVLELCGGELKDISEFEKLKRDDIPFQFVSEDDDDDDDEDNDEYEIVGLTDEDDINEFLQDDDEEDDEDDDDDDDDDDNKIDITKYYKI